MKSERKNQLPLEGIQDISPVSDGDINEAFKITTSDDIYFLLVQRSHKSSFYVAEMAGLEAFEKTDITAPRVVENDKINGNAYLLLSYLERGSKGSQKELGQLVAKMHSHQQSEGKFGFELPYEGANVSFDNTWSESWSEIFVERRMDHLKDELLHKDLWDEEGNKVYEQVRSIMIHELENHNSEPSLLHGDLWGGNYMFLKDGRPALFDPAPLYRDREFDLGITTIFGGFIQELYNEYEEYYPLGKGVEKRLELYRLYLFMVHLVKLGGMHASSVNRSMDQILA